MAHAQKNISNLPLKSVINIFASEGEFYLASRKLRELLRPLDEGKDVDWEEVTKARHELFAKTKIYTISVKDLENYMNKG